MDALDEPLEPTDHRDLVGTSFRGSVPVATVANADRVCFGLRLEHLHTNHRLSADAITADAVALVTALEGQDDTTFVLQTLAVPDPVHPEQGTIDIVLIAAVDRSSGEDRIEELADDLLDILATPPLRWTFSPIADVTDLRASLFPFEPHSIAEIARREEPYSLLPRHRSAGFRPEAEAGLPEQQRRLWSTWTLGPATTDLRRITSVLLTQEAPVCVRVMLTPTVMTDVERSTLEALVIDLDHELPERGQGRSALMTLEYMLALRPVFEARCLVASPDRLSRALLSTLGHSSSEPSDHVVPEPVLRGGFAIIRGDGTSDAPLATAYTSFSTSALSPTLGMPALARLRHLMGPREAANLFRVPVTSDDRFPGIDTLTVPDIAPPVSELPVVGQRIGSLIGHDGRAVLLDPTSRFRHTYVVGQTGTGKSTLLLNMALEDIEAGDGVAVLDPHGDLIEDLLDRIPADRADDVVVLDPADPEAVVGVNLLEADSPVQAAYLVEELSNLFMTLFDPNQQGIVGPRYISMLRQAARLLMSNPDSPSSLLDVATVYGDPAVRKYLVERSNDPMAMEYWATQDLASRSNDNGEVLAWFTSKFDTFRASDLVRNVLGQSRSTVSFSDILEGQKILLVNLSKGLLGNYNSGLIGYVVFAKLWGATLERAARPSSQRPPFHIYIDEFQNITSDSLPAVLSEARKFNVSLTLANQFFSQIPAETREALMGNIGSKITLRLGPTDAALFDQWMGDEVHADDLLRLPNHIALAALSRAGVPLPTFPIRTTPPREPAEAEHAQELRRRSREKWASPVSGLAEDFASRWAHVPGSFAARAKSRPAPSPAPAPSGPPGSSFLDDWLERRRNSTSGQRQDSTGSTATNGADDDDT